MKLNTLTTINFIAFLVTTTTLSVADGAGLRAPSRQQGRRAADMALSGNRLFNLIQGRMESFFIPSFEQMNDNEQLKDSGGSCGTVTYWDGTAAFECKSFRHEARIDYDPIGNPVQDSISPSTINAVNAVTWCALDATSTYTRGCSGYSIETDANGGLIEFPFQDPMDRINDILNELFPEGQVSGSSSIDTGLKSWDDRSSSSVETSSSHTSSTSYSSTTTETTTGTHERRLQRTGGR